MEQVLKKKDQEQEDGLENAGMLQQKTMLKNQVKVGVFGMVLAVDKEREND
ncbi:MAG: hypothetical protein R6X09_04320 [Bacteroidales bacterium]